MLRHTRTIRPQSKYTSSYSTILGLLPLSWCHNSTERTKPSRSFGSMVVVWRTVIVWSTAKIIRSQLSTFQGLLKLLYYFEFFHLVMLLFRQRIRSITLAYTRIRMVWYIKYTYRQTHTARSQVNALHKVEKLDGRNQLHVKCQPVTAVWGKILYDILL